VPDVKINFSAEFLAEPLKNGDNSVIYTPAEPWPYQPVFGSATTGHNHRGIRREGGVKAL
jgi:hypothetical protein